MMQHGTALRGSALPPIAAALCLAIALVNLVGWAAGIPALVALRPGLPAMVPMTALLSALAACALWLQWWRPALSGGRYVLPVVVLALCGAIGACYTVGAAPPPFRLAQAGHEVATTLSGPVTAALFLALGVGLLLGGGNDGKTASQGIASAVFLVAILNLGGYLSRDTFLFRILPGQGTSVMTTVEAILLAWGILFLHPHCGLMAAVSGNLPGAAVSRRLLMAAFAAPVLTGIAAVVAVRYRAYDTPTALTLFAWTLAVLLWVIVWRFALRFLEVDRARDEAQRELQQALERLRLEHEHKDVFLATLAHELRNPLAPIRSAAEVLRLGGGKEDADRHRIAEVIAAQAGNLTRLVDDLLDLERIASGRLVLERHVVDLRDAVATAFEQIRPLIERKAQRCTVEVPPAPVLVSADMTRLVQIVSNLINNAAKYTPSEGTIRVSVAPSASEATVTVEDNGIGMDRTFLAHAFEPYTQARLTSDRHEGGLGIGLSVVQRLAALHEGAVTAGSEGEGRGSRFTVTLPLHGAP